ncbi:hypothetical protein, partial [Thiolapillus sp.]|uniref:hypothetical protein n=1 Tax=Thiolapillus sp. TaxID=2017437 RepID=UPI0025F68BF6
DQVVLAIPYRVATVLVILHGIKLTIPTLPPKGVGFTDPLVGDFKKNPTEGFIAFCQGTTASARRCPSTKFGKFRTPSH